MRAFPVALALLTFCQGAAAASVMRPGLWEITGSSPLLALAEGIPPQQMQGLDNLARQYGFSVPTIRHDAATTRVCVTPEMAAQSVPPTLYAQQAGCVARHITQTGNRFQADISCDGADVSGTGQAEATFDTPMHFSGITVFKGTVRGVPVDDSAQTNGRWIAAECPAAGSE